MKRRNFLRSLGAALVAAPLVKHLPKKEEVFEIPSKEIFEPSRIIGHHPEIIISDFELVPSGMYVSMDKDGSRQQFYAANKTDLYDMNGNLVKEWPEELHCVASVYVEPCNRTI